MCIQMKKVIKYEGLEVFYVVLREYIVIIFFFWVILNTLLSKGLYVIRSGRVWQLLLKSFWNFVLDSLFGKCETGRFSTMAQRLQPGGLWASAFYRSNALPWLERSPRLIFLDVGGWWVCVFQLNIFRLYLDRMYRHCYPLYTIQKGEEW